MNTRETFEAWHRKVFALPDWYYAPLYKDNFPSIDVKAHYQVWQAATAAERERCAALCESLGTATNGIYERNQKCADAIRSGE